MKIYQLISTLLLVPSLLAMEAPLEAPQDRIPPNLIIDNNFPDTIEVRYTRDQRTSEMPENMITWRNEIVLPTQRATLLNIIKIQDLKLGTYGRVKGYFTFDKTRNYRLDPGFTAKNMSDLVHTGSYGNLPGWPKGKPYDILMTIKPTKLYKETQTQQQSAASKPLEWKGTKDYMQQAGASMWQTAISYASNIAQQATAWVAPFDVTVEAIEKVNPLAQLPSDPYEGKKVYEHFQKAVSLIKEGKTIYGRHILNIPEYASPADANTKLDTLLAEWNAKKDFYTRNQDMISVIHIANIINLIERAALYPDKEIPSNFLNKQ